MAGTSPTMGLRSCSVHPSLAFGLEDLGAVRHAGFELLELSFNRPKHGVIHDDRVQAAAFRREAERLGLTLVSHAPDKYWLSDPNREELAASLAGVREVLEGAAAFGARAMVIHCCPGQALMCGREEEQMEALVHALTCLAPECKRRGVCLAAETMVPGRLTSSIERLVKAIDRVDSPWVRLCVDTNHANLDQDLNQVVRLAGDRTVEFHLNDNHGECEEHLLPYEGAIDWPAFARAVVGTAFSGYMIMEPGGMYQDEADLLAKARRVADRLLADMVEES